MQGAVRCGILAHGSAFFYYRTMTLPRWFRSSEAPRPPRVVPVTVAVVLVAAGFFGGLAAGRLTPMSQPGVVGGHLTNTNQPLPAYLGKDVDFSLYWDLWNRVHQNYLEQPIVDTKLFYGSLEGMVAGLGDPYSVFMDPDTAKSFSNELEGSIQGIGAEIGLKDGALTVIAPLPGTPADKAGLKAGDRILAIDKTDTSGMGVDYAVSLIRGPSGTKVTLMILSHGDTTPRDVTITRAQIDVPLVQGEMKALPGGKGSVAYIKVSHFGQETDQLFRAQWQQLAVKGPRGLVLDLRNDPGGFLDQAIALSSHWLAADKAVVNEQGTPPNFKVYRSSGDDDLATVPTVVLVNGGSASASEIVTGALQDWRAATVVGEQTFGKGSVQDLQDLPDGSAVKLTIAKWFTPKGRSIDKNGITPDIVVKLTRQDADQGKDPQLDRALQLLTP